MKWLNKIFPRIEECRRRRLSWPESMPVMVDSKPYLHDLADQAGLGED